VKSRRVKDQRFCGVPILRTDNLEKENQVLREQLGGKRLLFTNRQRRRLAAKAKVIGRKGLFDKWQAVYIWIPGDSLQTFAERR
jgi:hypothetical protein